VVDVFFAVPGDLEAPTGGYAYARRMLALLPGPGIAVRHIPLPGSFPHPAAADLAETDRLLRATPETAVLLVDGLAYGAMPSHLIKGLGRTMVALVHHPLAFETGLSSDRQTELFHSERAALAEARCVIATSATMVRILASDYDVPGTRITIAEPGAEPAPRARGTGSPIELLAVGAVSPRKGYDVLVAALGELKELDWRLTIAGALDRAPDTAAALRAAIAETGLSDRIALAGAVEHAQLARLYDKADVFRSASLFEGHGMVLTEAMARGLPLVASTGGAAAETVPEGVGAKVPPGDAGALREALRRMIADPAFRRACAEQSWAAGQGLPRWSDTAAHVAEALRAAA
jgi:glycosyltransferase involved in cell wall biosynthesis